MQHSRNSGDFETVLGVIPARSGSRRVKDKNIRPLGGKPLMAWTIMAAKEAETLDEVVVSTDSERYAEHAKRLQVPVVMRPASLRGDIDTGLVVRHAVHELESCGRFDAVVVLQPTSPFRTSEDIDRAVRLLKPPFDSVVSVVEVSQHPAWMFRLKNGSLESFLGFPLRLLSGIIAQDLPKLYMPNGAIYVARREVVEEGRVYGDNPAAYPMPRERSLDIEEEFDFKLAEAMLQWQ
ncbi:MAG: acylneuraminate cytidylyltransferase family protein [Deltaproteobacteria bacterium]|nr:acylneuraminate cytidylyltransferase family protein [Deltaproteobacteria bacterium]